MWQPFVANNLLTFLYNQIKLSPKNKQEIKTFSVCWLTERFTYQSNADQIDRNWLKTNRALPILRLLSGAPNILSSRIVQWFEKKKTEFFIRKEAFAPYFKIELAFFLHINPSHSHTTLYKIMMCLIFEIFSQNCSCLSWVENSTKKMGNFAEFSSNKRSSWVVRC